MEAELNRVSSTKFLGVIIDENFNWKKAYTVGVLKLIKNLWKFIQN